MIKTAGMITVVLMSAILGIYFGNKEERRMKALMGIKDGLMIMRSEIFFSVATLADAALSAGEKINGTSAMLFSSFAEGLKAKNGHTAEEIWSNSLKNSIGALSINGEDIERLIALGAAFSSEDKQRSLNAIDITVSYIDTKNEELRNEGAKSKKLYPALCFFGGIMLVVFLV